MLACLVTLSVGVSNNRRCNSIRILLFLGQEFVLIQLILVLVQLTHEIQPQPGWYREALAAARTIKTGVLTFTHARGVGVVFGVGIDLQYAVADLSHLPDGDYLGSLQIHKAFAVFAVRAFHFSSHGSMRTCMKPAKPVLRRGHCAAPAGTLRCPGEDIALPR